MNDTSKLTLKSAILFTAFLFMGLWNIPLPQQGGLLNCGTIIGPKPSSAASKYGILGQTAPELDLDYWIDGKGKPIPPIRLTDYRGKVICLYFFQDW